MSKIIQFIKKLFKKESPSLLGFRAYLKNLSQQQLIDLDDVALIEGCLNVSKIKVRDIMIPRSQMVILNLNDSIEKVIDIIRTSKHSRFPVIKKSMDDIQGVLLAKSLFQDVHLSGVIKDFNMKERLLTPMFIPESKRLDNLLRELRASHQHMAIVVDEYGSISGLITIEDIVEQIIGEIEDEHFQSSEEELIYLSDKENSYIVSSYASIDQFNEFFSVNFSNEHFDTIGGLIACEFGHVPKRNEKIMYKKFEFITLKSNERTIELLEVKKIHL